MFFGGKLEVTVEEELDVVIAGGGLAGLTLALQLKRHRPELRVLVLEKLEQAPPPAIWKVGESTVELGAIYLARDLGLESYLAAHHLPKFGFRLFFSDQGNRNIATRPELGVSRLFPTSAWQIDRGRLEADLAHMLGDSFRRGARVEELQPGPPHLVKGRELGKEKSWRTNWFIDATGRSRFWVRRQKLQLEVPHPTHAVWFRIGQRCRIDDWSSQTSWQERLVERGRRWQSTNHLVGPGYWVWIIPLPGGFTSFGIVADSRFHALSTMNSQQKVQTWLRHHEPQLAERIQGLPLADFKVLRHYAHNAKSLFFPHQLAITGEAGRFLDPFYSPGTDFIAMANSLIADLILRQQDGEEISARTTIYDRLFAGLYNQSLTVYEGLYPLFGRPQAMSLKVVWDYALYWGSYSFLYAQGLLTDLITWARLGGEFAELGQWNLKVQAQLREFDKPLAEGTGIFIDKHCLPFLAELNHLLAVPHSPEEAKLRFRQNIALLGQLAQEILAYMSREEEGPMLEPLLRILNHKEPSIRGDSA
jgi:flavin-dependent dehydrogenase